MKKTVGSSAGVLALAAVLVHVFSGAGAEHPPPSPASRETGVLPSKLGPEAKRAPSVYTQQGPWTATQQYFHSNVDTTAPPYASCLANPTEACLRPIVKSLYGIPVETGPSARQFELHALIATVPDPLHTRMALETDRYLDAIQQAAFDSGFELASQWLPWKVKAAAEEADAEPSTFYDVEKLPGLLVFRPHFRPYVTNVDSLLLVFAVGETPTAGINGYQFEIARQSIFELDGGKQHYLRIAGPNFSGSFLSLTRLLEEPPFPDHVVLRSGTASNSGYVGAMLNDLQKKGFVIADSTPEKPEIRPSVVFHDSSLPSVSFRAHFTRLARNLGLKPHQIAEITEDETGFAYGAVCPAGQVTAACPESVRADSDGDPGTITYRYPRDIAQLRNTYNDAAFAPAQPEAAATPAVEFSLKDTQSGEDSFPTFSLNHTPVSQNAVLQEIATNLRHSQVRLVSLSATNVFDALFLAKVFARSCPDTRIVLQGADLLFVQEAAHGTLSGLMAISPFPLFPEGARGVPHSGDQNAFRDVTTFATSDQTSEFNAVLSLIAPFGGGGSYRQEFSPAQDGGFASAWVLVLSPRGWMPVDLYDQADRKLLEGSAPPVHWFDPSQHARKAQNAVSGLLSIDLAWIAVCLLIAGSAIGFCSRFFQLLFNPRRRVWSSLCLSDIGGARRGQAISHIVNSRYLWMIACFSTLAALNGFLLCPMLRLIFENGRAMSNQGWLIFSMVLLAGVCSAGIGICLAAFIVPVTSMRSVFFRLAVLVVAAAAVLSWWSCCSDGVRGYMLCFRTLTLATPVSPILPLLFAGSGIFAVSYVHLRRFTWGDRRQPFLEASVFDDVLCNLFQDLKTRLDGTLTTTFGPKGKTGAVLFVSVTFLFAIDVWILLPANSLSSFEPAGFSAILRLLLWILGLFAVTALVRFAWSWSLLRAFLVNLNSVALGRYFMRIPEFGGGGGPVWVREVKLMSLGTAINSCIALHNLQIIQKEGQNYTHRYMDSLKKFLAPADDKTTRLEFIRAYEEFRRCAGSIATELERDILRDYWRQNQLPFVGGVDYDEGESRAKKDATQEPLAFPEDSNQVKVLSAAVGGAHKLFFRSYRSEAAIGNPSSVALEEKSPSAEAYEQAARYVAMHYSAFIGYVLHQLQNLVLGCVACFVLLVLALNSLSFQAPQAIFHLVTAGLIIGGGVVLIAFAQMDRDPILSRLSGTTEGELGKDFYFRALGFGALPVLTVLSTEFPAISQYLSAFVQPVSAALH